MTCRGPDLPLFEQVVIDDRGNRGGMADGGNSANGKARGRSDLFGVLPDPAFAGTAEHPLLVEPMVTRHERENSGSGGFPAEDERFHDLTHFATQRRRRVGRGSGRRGELPHAPDEAVRFERGIDFPSRGMTYGLGRHAMSQLEVDAEGGYVSSGADAHEPTPEYRQFSSREASCVFNTGP